jgi:hypothetical protein
LIENSVSHISNCKDRRKTHKNIFAGHSEIK